MLLARGKFLNKFQIMIINKSIRSLKKGRIDLNLDTQDLLKEEINKIYIKIKTTSRYKVIKTQKK